MLSLRNMLINTTKDSKSIVEYMQAIKKIVNDLIIICYPLYEDELIAYALNGLGNDFKEISATIRARYSPMTSEELHDKP